MALADPDQRNPESMGERTTHEWRGAAPPPRPELARIWDTNGYGGGLNLKLNLLARPLRAPVHGTPW